MTKKEMHKIENETFGKEKQSFPAIPACSCGWNGKVDWRAKGQKCPNCGEELT